MYMAKRSRHAEDVRIHDSYSCTKRYISRRTNSLSSANNVIHIMAKFITRVELHDADYDDYETLHAAMDGSRMELRGTVWTSQQLKKLREGERH